jgi:predicted ATPase
LTKALIVAMRVDDFDARQQTLRNTLAWSHDLLESRQKTLFAQLSVFAGGWTLDAATPCAATTATSSSP